LAGGALGALPTNPLADLPTREDLPKAAPIRRALSQDLAATAGAPLTEVRRLAAARLIREHPEVVEADEHGDPVVRGEVLALAPSAAALGAARRAGFRIIGRTTSAELGLDSATLKAPDGLSAREALRRLQALDPQGQYEFDHIYQESGETGGAARGEASGGRAPRNVRVGLIDGSADAEHPALRRANLVQQAFAPGGARVTAHATAVASLLAGDDGAFHGAAAGATLLVADVYGRTPAGGSAAAIVKALAWLARSRVGVINISLVGPPNLVLGAAVRGLAERGVLLVAAVGNDGPAAPPLYPAAYPGVVAVTGVDARRQALPEAGRGRYVAFAAPGAQMAAAAPGGGFTAVRGTSFAAPIVAGELARELPTPDPAGAARALGRLQAAAVDLGSPGRDPVYGFGLVGFSLRTDPAQVGARTAALQGP
jgi:subtilisin family serine protease